MKKNLILWLVVLLSLLTSGCSKKEIEDKKEVVITSGKISSAIVIGKELPIYEFQDQFDKKHSLNSNVKKVIFVFAKPTGHLMRVYLDAKETDYLSKRDIDFIADVSGMPSIIFKMFALPDLKESKYSIMIIKDKEESKLFRIEEQKNAIMIISLENKIVKSVKFVTNETDLKNEID